MRSFALALAGLAVSGAAVAQSQTLRVATKVGRSNVEIAIVLHPQVARCAAPLVKEIRRQVEIEGQAYVRRHLAKVVKKSGTDASGDKEFFGLSFVAGCPPDGSAWIAFPAQGKNKSVSRYEQGGGWSPMTPL